MGTKCSKLLAWFFSFKIQIREGNDENSILGKDLPFSRPKLMQIIRFEEEKESSNSNNDNTNERTTTTTTPPPPPKQLANEFLLRQKTFIVLFTPFAWCSFFFSSHHLKCPDDRVTCLKAFTLCLSVCLCWLLF